MNRYYPLHSYGFVEAIEEAGPDQRLLGTSYWNTATPFIRYDTGDRVSADVDNGVVRSFTVAAGRIGDFVVDRSGARISLTALIFGRHHEAFNNVRHIQVRQSRPGEIDLLIVPYGNDVSLDGVMSNFDFANVKLKVTPQFVDEPKRTDGGKIRLLVP